jgi:hypothetical protein
MRGLADRRVVHMQIVTNGAHDHLATIETDTRLDEHTVPAVYLLRVATQSHPHRQGSITGSDGMVFMGQRSPEERHDTVPEDLIHRPLVAVDRRHHDVQRWV